MLINKIIILFINKIYNFNLKNQKFKNLQIMKI